LPSEAPGALGDRLARLCLDLCARYSVIGHERALCDHLQARFAGSAWQATRCGNALALRGPRGGRPLVCLAGHLDTVPPARGGAYDPGDEPAERLPAWREGDLLYGLGASDMKSGLTLMLALAEDLDLQALPWDLALVFYDREEGPYLENGLEPLLDAAPWLGQSALGVLLEPSDDMVQLGCLGSMHGWACFEGQRAHSARPWQGRNAMHMASGLLAAVAAHPPREVLLGGLLFTESLSVTMVKPPGIRNVVPQRFALNLNFRFAPDRSPEQAEAWLRAFVARASAGQARLEITDLAPAGPVASDAPLVQHYLALSGVPPQPKLGWTDVARLSLRGIPAVNHGPGLSSQAHQAGEHTHLGPLVACYHSLRRFLETPLPDPGEG